MRYCVKDSASGSCKIYTLDIPAGSWYNGSSSEMVASEAKRKVAKDLQSGGKHGIMVLVESEAENNKRRQYAKSVR